MLVVLPLAVILYLRRSQLVALLRGLPEQFVVSVLGVTYAVEAGEVAATLAEYATDAALGVARAVPVLSAKLIVFGLLLRRKELRRGVLAPLPAEYHDIAQAFHERTRETLFALYVIQAATALGTFAIGAVVFWAFGYRYPVALAGIAGILQFLPVVGPSVVVVGLAAYEASLGAYWRMSLVFQVGLVAVLPDAVLRPRLASRTAHLPESLYVVGFAGGVLSLGPVGIIAGPLVLGLLLEAFSPLADEVAAGSGASPDRH